ncbi:hypothetical protein QBC38DRAFT_496990 [Podospora fimiseda]|uniref:Uncharacterized protein n=1 Tax=Podospora fimiseda TaxID=252190 RepID=A0AAN7H3M0_9PEZI|nr:hypothetical protein QBC38DRAFT_496990 [Podospora fimiseda]
MAGKAFWLEADLFALIDYLTSLLARLMCSYTKNEITCSVILAHLAKISAKVKVISTTPREYAEASLNGELDINELTEHRKGNFQLPGGGSRHSPPYGQLEPQAETGNHGLSRGGQGTGRGGTWAFGNLQANDNSSDSKKDALRNMYYNQVNVVRTSLLEALSRHLVLVRGNNRLMTRRVSRKEYDICSVVYETGFEGFQTLVFQDQDNNLDGTADSATINYAYHAFRQLFKTVQCFKREHAQQAPAQQAPAQQTPVQQTPANQGLAVRANNLNTTAQTDPQSADQEPLGTQITWSFYDRGSEDKASDLTAGRDYYEEDEIELKSMNEVISVMMTLLFTSPTLIIMMEFFLGLLGSQKLHLVGESRASQPSQNFTASFCIDTKLFREAQDKQEAKSLSKSLIRRNALQSGKEIGQLGRVETFRPNGQGTTTPNRDAEKQRAKAHADRIRMHQSELHKASKKLKACIFEEKGVMVRCRLYILTTVILCTILVFGGIAVGATVGDRISGVDPFNITTYCWVLAAFIVIVAKSVLVHEWPWNDFLHGRVLCKSVSELYSVTGLNDQLILAYMLQNESNSFLDTRGPFNIVFDRKVDDGFSIDRPLSTWTMLVSGLLMVEVENDEGRGLVGLDLRRGRSHGEVDAIKDSAGGTKEEETYLYCRKLDNQVLREDRQTRVRLAYARGTTWNRVVGFYGNRNAVFV